MKKKSTILLSLIMIFCLTACGNSAGGAERSFTENNAIENGAGNDAKSSIDDNAQAESSAKDDVQTQTSDTQTEKESADQSENIDVNDTENAGYSETQQPEADTPEVQGNRVLVAYFSATGTTEGVAEHIANGLNADIYKIIPFCFHGGGRFGRA